MRRPGSVVLQERPSTLPGPFVAKRHRQCKRCARPFIDGLVLIERGFIASGVCQTCLERAKSGEIDASELFPS